MSSIVNHVEPVTSSVAERAAPSQPDPSPVAASSTWRQRRRAARLARWERPPHPRDWRFYVGGLGRILITLGLLLFGFVAYQLWGTGIETARAQNRLEDEFVQATAQLDPTPVTAPAPPADLAVFEAPPVTVPGAPSVPEQAVVDPTDVVVLPTPEVERGDGLFRLEIPRIDEDLIVVAGVSLDDLQNGPGHYPDSPLPGQLGNSAIAGHRTTWGEPFRHIDELAPGDEIIVTARTGERYVYEVWYTEIVEASDYHVVTTRDPTVAELTLTSCHPVFTSKQRIAVHALLNVDKSSVVGVPTFYDLDAPTGAAADEAATGTTPAVVPSQPSTEPSTEPSTATSAPSTVPTPTSAPSTNPTPTSAPSTAPASLPPTTTAPAPVAGQGVDTGELSDAFGEGWFHDRAAWPHIAAWSAALIAVAWVVRRLSKRWRNYAIGVAVGAVPFVVCLYFFYQNVNRLLPPGI